jgi:hypothetical protein
MAIVRILSIWIEVRVAVSAGGRVRGDASGSIGRKCNNDGRNLLVGGLRLGRILVDDDFADRSEEELQ